MKKRACVVVVVFLFITAGAVFAQGPSDTGPMKGKGDMRGHPMGMCPCPMHGMMGKEVVATQDGGIVVLMADKIIKYDKDLNKVKEATIEIDWQHMQDVMQKMQRQCPGGQHMMPRGGMMQQQTDQPSQGQTSGQ